MRRSPKESQQSTRSITRRGLLLGGAQMAVVAVLAARMRKMQLEDSAQYRLLAEGNSVKIRLIPPARGLIYDRNGVLLAGNEQNYRVTITREDTDNVAATLADLRKLVPITDSDAADILHDIRRRPPTTPVTVADRLSWDEFSRVAVNTPSLPGVSPDVGLSRAYPRREDFAHVIGYVGPVSDYDLSKMEDPDPLLMIPKFQLGKTGIEAKEEDVLRGEAGQRRVEVNSAGREMRELSREPGKPGENLQLTIDYRLQNYALKRLENESAACVVIDVTNGDVLACTSAPSFDPNMFVRGISVAQYQELTQNDHRPLADKSVQGLYPPGSTYKMVTALAALEAGLTTPNETVWCPGYVEIAGRRFHCWKRAGHGHVDMTKSMQQSCDVYYYEMSQRVGIDKMSAMAERLGFGARPDLPMSAVKEGVAPTKTWKRERYGKDWLIGDTANAAIGQGYVLASPMHLAIMAARIASGKKVEPRLIRTRDGIEQPIRVSDDLDIDPDHLIDVRRGMNAVVNSARGTARGARIERDEWKMAGKTGSAQVRNISKAERARGVIRNDQLPWDQRDHALFVAFAPVDNPRYAVSVVVEHGSGGSTTAAPIARDVLLFAQAGGLPPDDAYPAFARKAAQELNASLDLVDPETVQKPQAKSRA
ncbi:penicillin-binding protein [Thioclava dalianensis]|uniref:Penicillin-binding protein n=1 Tax=Thioclava dalianensis TaxID=1185766 RepID=A0A074U6E3_9RHOB|nr:penicillin-binding protein 2 [Thioclava dalianensis]KEP70207.1 penicillin-binding protein [Thioclava dalianensis]SFM81893.1 penicillin-binding protein 2 [Thioclava dalianensis]